MRYFIIAIMILAACMLVFYFLAAILKNRILYAVFKLFLCLLELCLIIAWVRSFVVGQHYFLLIPLIIIFGFLLYEA